MPRSRYDEGIEILKTMMEDFPVGDPWTPGNMQGPQISETQRQKVLGLIKSGIDSGARLGHRRRHSRATCRSATTSQPTLLADVDPDSQVAQEEIFGPGADRHAVRHRRRGGRDRQQLASTDCRARCSGGDVDRAFAVATRMRTGNVTINGKSHFGIASPFGGTKQSGLGYRNGEEGYKEYLDAKTIGMPE